MSTGAIITIVVVLALVVAAGVFFLLPRMRSQRLRRQFGPEYDHAVDRTGDRRAAERELADRERRHSDFELKPISDEHREQYRAEWSRIQEQFVEAPQNAVAEADRLVNVVVAEMGYPSEGYERQLADLSVRHAETVEHYRHAHDLRERADASTDDLRTALIDYRKVFDDLIDRNQIGHGKGEHGKGEHGGNAHGENDRGGRANVRDGHENGGHKRDDEAVHGA